MSKASGARLPRQISNEEYLVGVEQLLIRLEDHAGAVAAGSEHRLADLAAVLRTLFGRGRGDDVLGGLYRRLRLPQPTFSVSHPPEDGPGIAFAFGSTLGGASAKDSLSLQELQDRLILVADVEGEVWRVTWVRLVEDYANTWGAHLSGTVPGYLDDVQVAAGGNRPLGAYLLLSLASALQAVVLATPGTAKAMQGVPRIDVPTSSVAGGLIRREAQRSYEVIPRLNHEPRDGEVLLAASLYEGPHMTVTWRAPRRIEVRIGKSAVLSDLIEGIPPW